MEFVKIIGRGNNIQKIKSDLFSTYSSAWPCRFAAGKNQKDITLKWLISQIPIMHYCNHIMVIWNKKSVNRNKRPCDMMQPVTWTHWNIPSPMYKMLIWKNIFEKKLMAQSGSICSIFSFGTFKSPLSVSRGQ